MYPVYEKEAERIIQSTINTIQHTSSIVQILSSFVQHPQ